MLSTRQERITVNKHVAQKPRSKKAEQRAETMEQILDAAEDLFSKHGLHGVTLKEVAQRVGVHHTLLNYYFSDKKTLFDAVFARRAVVTSERRIKALDDYDRESNGKPTVEAPVGTVTSQPAGIDCTGTTCSTTVKVSRSCLDDECYDWPAAFALMRHGQCQSRNSQWCLIPR